MRMSPGPIFSIILVLLLTACSTRRDNRPINVADYPARIRVACVGDSITYGYGFSNRERESYPAQLQALLGDRWEVRNFGFNGATALKNGTKPYSLLPVYREALSFNPDVVIIQLGTNDTSPKNWPSHAPEFLSDYLALVRSFQELETKPRIYICRPVPLFRDRGKEHDTDKILVEEIIPQIEAVARQQRLPLIDLYAVFENKADLFPDGVHPDTHGARIMAETVNAKLVGPK